LPFRFSGRRVTRVCAAFVFAACVPALAIAADAPIVASRDDAFITHRSGTDVWTIGSENLELTLGFDASRALTQRLSNPSAGHTWDITPGPDVILVAGGERVALAASAAVSLINVDAQATAHGVVLTFAFELLSQQRQISRSYASYPGSPTIETWTHVSATGGDVALSGLVAWQMTTPIGRVRWLGGLRGDTAGGAVEDAFMVADRDLAPGERVELGASRRSSEQFVPLLFVDGERDEFFGGLMWSTRCAPII
jgi:hypothetical protein